MITPQATKILIRILVILNIIDALMTIYWIEKKIATEANPIMNSFMFYGMEAFFLIKMAVIIAGSTVLWSYREKKIAWYGLILTVVVYTVLIAYHIYGVIQYARI